MKLPKNLNPLYPPYGQFQIDTIGFGVIHDNPGILLPVGKGKTYCSINICKWRIQNCNVKKIFIFCPDSISEKWKDEIKKFSGYDSIILHDKARKKREELINIYTHSDIIFGIINYEGLYPYYDQLKKIKVDMIVADESSRYIKNVISSQRDRTGKRIHVKRSNTAIFLGDNAKYRMILTANLINKPMDAWTQFRFLDKGKIFGDNFWAFRNFFFKKVNYGTFEKWELKKDKISLLNSKIYSTCIKFDKKDIAKDLPETTYQIIPIKMNDDFAKTYNKIKLKVLSEIETEKGKAIVNIMHIFTKLIRLQQVTSGFIKDIDNSIKDLKYKPKLEAIIEETESILDSEEAVIIWCRFRHTIKMISDSLSKRKIKYTVMHGDTKNKGDVWKGFQKSKDTNVFIGQIIAGGIGIELFKLDYDKEYQHVLFAENVFGLDPRIQAIGRAEQRIGQKSACRVVDFLVKDTIDEKIYNSIKEDKEVADMIMKNGVTNWLG